jgi:citrate lyase beta subunit
VATPIRQVAMLYVPADERRLAKLPTLGAGAVILDLEDSVPEPMKERARELAAATIEAGAAPELWVRINGLDTPHWRADLEAVVSAGLAGIVLPKADSAAILERLDGALADLGDANGEIEVVATIESARGLLNAHEVARAPRVRHLSFGAADLSLDLGLEWPPPGGESPTLAWGRAKVVVASRAAGLEGPDDGVFGRHADLEGLRAEAERSLALGFGGKHAIHPAQVSVIEAVFRPGADELARAREVVAAYLEAVRGGSGAVASNGAMVDRPVYERARRMLDAAGEASG